MKFWSRANWHVDSASSGETLCSDFFKLACFASPSCQSIPNTKPLRINVAMETHHFSQEHHLPIGTVWLQNHVRYLWILFDITHIYIYIICRIQDQWVKDEILFWKEDFCWMSAGFPEGSWVASHRPSVLVSDLRTIKRGNDGNEQCPEPLVMVKHRGMPQTPSARGRLY